MIRPLQQRILLMLARGIVSDSTDTDGVQRILAEVLKDEVLDKLERFQNYGFSSRPLDGAEALITFVGGNRDHGIVIAVEDRRYRLKAMEKGEVALYSDEGDFVHLKRDRKMEIGTLELTINAETKAIINSPETEINAETSVVITTPKFNVVGQSGELLDIVSDLIQELITGVTATAIGPQKFVGAGLAALKTKADALKG